MCINVPMMHNFMNQDHSTPVAAAEAKKKNKQKNIFPQQTENNWMAFVSLRPPLPPPSSQASPSGLDLILCSTQHESVKSAAEGVCYLPETLDLCSLSPAALHLPARCCRCSFLGRHSRRYSRLICCSSRNTHTHRKKQAAAVLSSHVFTGVRALNEKVFFSPFRETKSVFQAAPLRSFYRSE